MRQEQGRVRVGCVGPVAEPELADRLIDEEAEAGCRERGGGGELEPERSTGAGEEPEKAGCNREGGDAGGGELLDDVLRRIVAAQ
jgi:hypothetical protein